MLTTINGTHTLPIRDNSQRFTISGPSRCILDFFGSGTKPNFGTTGERECKSANYDEAKLRAYRDPGALIT